MSKPKFESSPELKTLFRDQYTAWSTRNQAGIDELARRCGVSSSYMSHVKRYGRIPGKPVLMLLAFNFEMKNPQELFSAANIYDPWPYNQKLALQERGENDSGFLSIKLDMDGFAHQIKEIIRSEARPKSIQELIKGRPLRVGYNLYQGWLFGSIHAGKLEETSGFFPEFINLLAVSLRCRIEPHIVEHTEFLSKFKNDELDIYGPVAFTPNMVGHASSSNPFCTIGISGVMRKRKAKSLDELPSPKTPSDMTTHDYKIAVLRNSRCHLYANTRLERSDEELLLCETLDEAVERITLSGIKRPAHLLICDSASAIEAHKEYTRDTELIFAGTDDVLKMSENVIAVRPDWPEFLSTLNDSISYLIRSGSLSERFSQWVSEDFGGVVRVAE